MPQLALNIMSRALLLAEELPGLSVEECEDERIRSYSIIPTQESGVIVGITRLTSYQHRHAPSRWHIFRNFTLMSFCFSLNHGCVNACIGLASADLGASLGAWSSGLLYLCYTLSALLLANYIVSLTGVKWGIASALGFNCLYIASFIVALVSSSVAVQWIFVIFGSSVGGIAAGYLWTSHAPFFAASSALWSAHAIKKKPRTTLSHETRRANSIFGATFGAIFLISECLMKILSTWIPQEFSSGESSIYVVFTIISALGTLVMATCVEDLHALYLTVPGPSPLPSPPVPVEAADAAARAITRAEDSNAREIAAEGTATSQEAVGVARVKEEQNASEGSKICSKVFSATKLLLADPRMVCLYPLQIAFGFATTFVAYYANGVLVVRCINAADGSGTNYIGYMGAIISGTAAVCAPVFSLLTNAVFRGSKVPVMLFGICAFLAEMATYAALSVPTDDLVRGEGLCQPQLLVFLYVVQGTGRAVWESTNKAVVLDFFPHDPVAAFANVIVASGGASTLGFFMYQFNDHALVDRPQPIALFTAVMFGVSFITYLAAVAYNRHFPLRTVQEKLIQGHDT